MRIWLISLSLLIRRDSIETLKKVRNDAKRRKLALFTLHILAGDCQIADKADDQDRQDQGDLCITQPKTTQNRLPKPASKPNPPSPTHDLDNPNHNHPTIPNTPQH